MIVPCGTGTAAVFTAADVDLTFFARVKQRVRRGGQKRKRAVFPDMICAWDIETTTPGTQALFFDGDLSWPEDTEGDCSFMWSWQFAFLPAAGSEEIRTKRGIHLKQISPVVVMGETWEEFQLLLARIRETVGDECTVAVYVHNLSFESHFAFGILPFTSGFVVGDKKIARLDMPGFEFRCSYCYTNKSLQMLTEGRVKHAKTSGDLNFRIYREPGDYVTAMERQYMYNDVAGLVEALYKEFQNYAENVATVVMTSTGHVRRYINRAEDYKLREIKWACEQNYSIAKKHHRLFRGGDTHGNRSMIGIIQEDATGRDKKSSYPSALLLKMFPVSSFVPIKDLSFASWHKWAWAKNYRSFALVTVSGLAIKRNAPDPYIARAKVEHVVNTSCDNGRILYADEVTLYVTDLDWRIIEDAYTFDEVLVLEAYASKADYLPKAFTKLVQEFFYQKEVLGAAVKKHKAEGNLEAADRIEEERSKFKALVNAFYGCLAEWLHLDELQYNQDKLCFESVLHDEPGYEEEVWKRRNKSRLPYQWGVWTTAWARYEYYKGVKAVCGDFSCPGNWIYGDTDSCKYLSTPEVEERFEALNASIRKECEEAPVKGYVDVNGKRVYLGVWEVEGHYDKFITWGAKKYAYTDERGLHVTVAGLGKTSGAKYLAAHGGIEAFDRGFVWPEGASGRTRAIYSDPTPAHEITLASGRKITSAGWIEIVDTTYKLDITDEFSSLLYSLQPLDADPVF